MTRALAVLLAAAAVGCAAAPPPSHPGTLDVAGWTVHVRPELRERDPEALDRALALLRGQLEAVVRDVPAPAVAELRKVPLWFCPEYPGVKPRGEYHPDAGWLRANGRDPAMQHAVEFTNVRRFAEEADRMPCFVFHELAHAYYFRVLGPSHAEIRTRWKSAKETGIYDRVERRFGSGRPATREPAYAIQDPMEYFAECSEAYFGRNDFYPFTRAELRAHDPAMARLVARLWGAPEEP
jgi:dipeptidyl-peptidase-4